MRGVVPADQEARRLVEGCLGISISEPFAGLVFYDGARPIGAAIFNNYNGRNVNFTCVLAEGDVGIRICRQVAHYIFKQLKCHRCTSVTSRSNVKAVVALLKLGFKWEGVLREYWPGGEDGLVYGLLWHEQRLLRNMD